MKDLIFLCSNITVDGNCSNEIKDACSLEEKLWQNSYDKIAREHIKKQRHYFADKGSYSQSYGFSSSHVWTVRVGP